MDGFENQLPTQSRVIPWKTIAIIGGTVVLLVLIVLGARWFITSQSTGLKREELLSQINQELDQALETCETDRCRINKVEEVAQQFGAAELCNRLSGSSLTSCVWKVAQDKMDPKECESITDDEKRVDCQDLIYRSLANDELDLSWCEKIQDNIVRERCVSNLSESIAREKGCLGTGVDQSVCDNLVALEIAIESVDPDQCMTLPDPSDQDDCLEGISTIDADHDGLTAVYEVSIGTSDSSWDTDKDGLGDSVEIKLYKTDPTNPDSDGDGYLDGEEVKNGYNPLGSGKL